MGCWVLICFGGLVCLEVVVRGGLLLVVGVFLLWLSFFGSLFVCLVVVFVVCWLLACLLVACLFGGLVGWFVGCLLVWLAGL